MRATTLRLTTLLLVLALALAPGAGCGARPSGTTGADGGADRGVTPGPDGLAGPGGWSFAAADDGSAAAAVALKLESLTGDTLTLLVVGRGVPQLQGVAFRLRFDPQRLQVIKTELGGAWTGSASQIVSRFATRPSGEVWAGIGHAGSYGLKATQPVTLARLELRLLPGAGTAPLAIAFRPKHNLVLDPAAKGVEVAWLGGELRRKAK